MGEKRNGFRVLVGKPEGKRLLGRPRRRWEDNIKMNLRTIGSPEVKWEGRDADHSPPSSAQVKNDGAIPPLSHISSWHSA
jgi:hypothetical protein